MDRVGAADLGGGQDRELVEIGFAGRRRTDADAGIGEADVHRLGVGGRMDRDGLDADLAAGADDPERDLAAIGDQDLVEHRGGRRPATR